MHEYHGTPELGLNNKHESVLQRCKQDRLEKIKRTPTRKARVGLGALALSVILAGCADLSQPLFQGAFPNPSTPTRSVATDAMSSDPSTFAQITDIPIPANSRLNVNRSIILGGQDQWTGRAEIETPYSSAEMYDFFRREMITFGWTELTSVRSDESVITFLRGQRISTVQIFGAGGGLVGSVISLTVAPVGSNGVLVQPSGSTTFGAPTPQVQQRNIPAPQNAPPANAGAFVTPTPRPQ